MTLARIVVCFCLLASAFCSRELVSIALITRHGDRSTLYNVGSDKYPTHWNCTLTNEFWVQGLDLHRGTTFIKEFDEGKQMLAGNCFAGQLTSDGALQHRELGKQLRETYKDFLPELCEMPECYLRSTRVERTQQSLMFNVQALFANQTKFQIHQIDSKSEWMYPNMNTDWCPVLVQEISEYQNSDAYKERESALDYLLPVFKEKTGFDVPDWNEVWDWLACRQAHGIDLPDFVTAEDFEKITNFTEFEYFNFYGGIRAKLSIGEHVKEVLNTLKDAESDGRKFSFWSGHDTTIIPWLNVLQTTVSKWPRYATHLIFELHKDTEQYFIRTIYNDEVLTLPFCDGEVYCTLTNFENGVQDFIPQDWKQECLGE